MSDDIEYFCPPPDHVYDRYRPSKSRLSEMSPEGRAQRAIRGLKRRLCLGRIPSFRRDINSR